MDGQQIMSQSMLQSFLAREWEMGLFQISVSEKEFHRAFNLLLCDILNQKLTLSSINITSTKLCCLIGYFLRRMLKKRRCL